MSRHGFSRIAYSMLAASVAFGTAVMAQNQSASGTLPDAQIEANVLRALAGAPDLSTQNIQSATVYGTVTLTGNVHDEAMRTKAENLVARAVGVKKVVDEMTLGDTPAPSDQASTSDQNTSQTPNCEPQSDGTCTPAAQPSQQAENTPPPIPNQAQPDWRPAAVFCGSPGIAARAINIQAATALRRVNHRTRHLQAINRDPSGYGPPQAQPNISQ